MKQLLISIIRKRNPHFTFHPALSSSMIFWVVLEKCIAILRGFKLLLRLRNPKMMMLGKKVKFRFMNRLQFGKALRIDDNCYISAFGSEGISFGNHVNIGAFSRVIVSTSMSAFGRFIRIGNNVGIGEFAYLGGAGGLTIGDECIIGQYFSCHPENHHFESTDISIRFQGVSHKGIVVGKNCWIGSKVTILDGVIIGDNCVIAAGSVVTKSMPANAVIGGVPAKILKMRIETFEPMRKAV
jgi:acetyltransferase-like isoleucine patch superfamily enzyme